MPAARTTNRVNPSIKDVARRAGVSIATVSNVINRPEKVSPTTATKVRAVIEEMAFVRNDAARSLATGTSKSLGLVLADIENALFVDMAHGAQEAAKNAGYRLVLANAACDLKQQEDYLDLFDEARVAGLLLAPMEDSSAGINRMRSHGRQITLLNYAQENQDTCTVLVDNVQVGYLAARHLIESGRRRIAFVAGRDFYQPVHDRRVGVKRAVAESAGVSLEEIDTRGLLREDGLEVARQLLMRRADLVPDGIVAVSDAIANGVIQGIEDDGTIRVPRDVGVVGCEDNRSASSGPIPLTAVRLPGADMGAAATELLLEELSSTTHEHRTIVLQPELVVRASTIDPHTSI